VRVCKKTLEKLAGARCEAFPFSMGPSRGKKNWPQTGQFWVISAWDRMRRLLRRILLAGRSGRRPAIDRIGLIG